MTLLQEVEEKITQMSNSERAELMEWFENYEADTWDNEIEIDIKAGKLDKLSMDALRDFDLGKVRSL